MGHYNQQVVDGGVGGYPCYDSDGVFGGVETVFKGCPSAETASSNEDFAIAFCFFWTWIVICGDECHNFPYNPRERVNIRD